MEVDTGDCKATSAHEATGPDSDDETDDVSKVAVDSDDDSDDDDPVGGAPPSDDLFGEELDEADTRWYNDQTSRLKRPSAAGPSQPPPPPGGAAASSGPPRPPAAPASAGDNPVEPGDDSAAFQSDDAHHHRVLDGPSLNCPGAACVARSDTTRGATRRPARAAARRGMSGISRLRATSDPSRRATPVSVRACASVCLYRKFPSFCGGAAWGTPRLSEQPPLARHSLFACVVCSVIRDRCGARCWGWPACFTTLVLRGLAQPHER